MAAPPSTTPLTAGLRPRPVLRALGRQETLAVLLVAEAAAFSVGLWLEWGTIVRTLYWNADAAAAVVIASTFSHAGGSGTVLEHFGYFTTVGWELLSRGLPFHRTIWTATPYAFSLASAFLLAWASRRVAGRWAGAATFALCICTAPLATYGLFTLNFHSSTWFTTVVLGVYLVAARQILSDGGPRLLVVSGLVGALAGANAASDTLLVFTAFIPLVVIALAMVVLERRDAAWFVGGIACLVASAAVVGEALSILMRHLRFTIVQQPAQFAGWHDLWPSTAHLGEQVLPLFGGDFWTRDFGIGWLLAAACAVIVSATAVLGMRLAVLRLLLARRCSEPQRDLPYLLFWILVPLTVSASDVFSTVGVHGGWYFLSFVYAFAAVLPLLAAHGAGRRVAATAAVSICSIGAFVGVQTRWHTIGWVPAFDAQLPRLEQIARANHATVAYGDYWTALPVSWANHLRLPVYPVYECATPLNSRLCPFLQNANTRWYTPRPHTNSLLLVRPGDIWVHDTPSASLGKWTKRIPLGGYDVYVFPYDIASRLGGSLPYE
jgi:hypothetical protein